jgi:hypothetical protein
MYKKNPHIQVEMKAAEKEISGHKINRKGGGR